jgi:hypothetical protein
MRLFGGVGLHRLDIVAMTTEFESRFNGITGE